jgi:MFS family permease
MPEPPKLSRAAFIFVFDTVALYMLALGVMIPVPPNLIAHFEGGDLGRAASTVGVFGFAGALMQFVFRPVLGAGSDRFGGRPVILMSNLGLGLDYLLMALAPSLGFLFVARRLLRARGGYPAREPRGGVAGAANAKFAAKRKRGGDRLKRNEPPSLEMRGQSPVAKPPVREWRVSEPRTFAR